MTIENAIAGSKVYFHEYKRPYTVRCRNERFLICTQPFNLKKTVLYTIIDLEKNIRGTENLIFCMGYESDLDCLEALERLQSNESEVSKRNFVQLDIKKVI